jgi:hypothetical protein
MDDIRERARGRRREVIVFYEQDRDLTVEEIERFIDLTDTFGVFGTKDKYHGNFVKHFEKLLKVNQVLTFREDGKLIGLCSWAMVDRDRKQDINKTRWELPENVTGGDILYIDICLLKTGAEILKIKRFFNAKYRASVKEVFWFDIPHSRVFRTKITGGVPCQTTAG